MARRSGLLLHRRNVVLPAHAGMARVLPSDRVVVSRSPRTRGDGPCFRGGCKTLRCVLPAHAGMARRDPDSAPRPQWFSPHTRGWPDSAGAAYPHAAGSPRTRGDGPPCWGYQLRADRFSPHTRGWPAFAASVLQDTSRSPRTRGDGPRAEATVTVMVTFSPHTRGWPDLRAFARRHPARSPRTRGDGPVLAMAMAKMRGVLPAHAGMARASMWART